MELLIYNPAWIRKLMHHFLSGVNHNKNLRLELIYFALPILYDEYLLEKLSKYNVRSTLTSLSNDVPSKVRLLNLKSKAITFKKQTNDAMILLGKDHITIENGFIFTPLPIHYSSASDPMKKHFKAAFNLGNILAKDHYREVFMKLGVYS